jgi:hypothetical protein
MKCTELPIECSTGIKFLSLLNKHHFNTTLYFLLFRYTSVTFIFGVYKVTSVNKKAKEKEKKWNIHLTRLEILDCSARRHPQPPNKGSLNLKSGNLSKREPRSLTMLLHGYKMSYSSILYNYMMLYICFTNRGTGNRRAPKQLASGTASPHLYFSALPNAEFSTFFLLWLQTILQGMRSQRGSNPQ